MPPNEPDVVASPPEPPVAPDRCYEDVPIEVVGGVTHEEGHEDPARRVADQEWDHFVEFSKYMHGELKKKFPRLPMAQSVTLHVLLDKKLPNLEQYQKRIETFISDYDFNAISFYPFFMGLHYYDEFVVALRAIRQFGEKPIAISETGHPAEPIVAKTWNLNIPSSPEEQNEFIKALLNQAQADKYLFVTQFACRDYDELWKRFPEEVKDLGRLWRDTGLVDENNNKRLACQTWVSVLAKKKT